MNLQTLKRANELKREIDDVEQDLKSLADIRKGKDAYITNISNAYCPIPDSVLGKVCALCRDLLEQKCELLKEEMSKL